MEYSKLKKYAIEHIKKDIVANKSLNGIDFSQFLAEYIAICTSHQYLKPLIRESFKERIPLKMIVLQERLSEELGKPVRFQDSAKAGVAIIDIFDRTELDQLDKYAEGLVAKLDMDSFDANTLASQNFVRILI